MSIPSQSNQTLGRPAHPMPGYLCVMPIPASEEAQKIAVEGFLGLAVEVDAGVIAGIVMEVNLEDPPGYEDGCTVFYFEQRVIKIGGFHFVAAQYVIAWNEAPR